MTVICPWEAYSHLELHELAQYGIIWVESLFHINSYLTESNRSVNASNLHLEVTQNKLPLKHGFVLVSVPVRTSVITLNKDSSGFSI